MANRKILFWSLKFTVPAPAYLTAESCEFAQGDDEIVKHIAEAVVGRYHGTLPVMVPHPTTERVSGRQGSLQVSEET